MKQLLLLPFFLLIMSNGLFAQESPNEDDFNFPDESGEVKRQFSKPQKKKKKPPITWYKIINKEKDSIYLDTTLTIQKEYKYNYLRKDNFELIPLSNVGRPYVQLAKQAQEYRAFPKFGARARHLGFFKTEDISYYRTPTPLTDLYYKTVFEQGQQLDALLTLNTSPNFNFSLAYKGVRSLGDYRDELTSTKSFRGTLSYNTKNNRYVANLHFVDQSIFNEENGGFSAQSRLDFLSGESDFERRSVLDLTFRGVSNELEGRRFYISHEYRIVKQDTLSRNQLAVVHRFNNSTKTFRFNQEAPTSNILGTSLLENDINDKNELEYIENSLGFKYSNTRLGKIEFLAKHSFFNYRYDAIFLRENGNNIPNLISDNLYGFTGKYQNAYNGFLINTNIESTLVGDFKNQHFYGTVGYKHGNLFTLKAGYKVTSEVPEINKLLNQSSYLSYNWFNNFDNTVTNSLIASFESKYFFDAEVTLSNIDDYTYFSRVQADNSPIEVINPTTRNTELQQVLVSTPTQADNSLRLLKLKLFREFKFRNFRLTNTLLFQQVDGNTNDLVYNVPTFSTRNSLYYQNEIFKKAMFVQLGTTFRYYSAYYTDGYDPLLGDNYTQNTEKFGDYPLVDVFLNAKVRQTRIFLKVENLQHVLEQNTTLLDPNNPTRDFKIRFGLVWNFFL